MHTQAAHASGTPVHTHTHTLTVERWDALSVLEVMLMASSVLALWGIGLLSNPPASCIMPAYSRRGFHTGIRHNSK